MKDRIYLWALLGMDLDEAWDRLKDQREIFRDPKNRPLDRTGFGGVLQSSLPDFADKIAPELLRLGILSRKSSS